MIDDKFTEKSGLFLGVACANLMSVSMVGAISTDDIFYWVPAAISTVGMVAGFLVYCRSNNK